MTGPENQPTEKLALTLTAGKVRAVLVGLGLAILASVLLLTQTGVGITTRYAPMVDAAMEIKYEASRFHLWFEELVQGDTTLTEAMVWEHLNRSEWFARAMLEGGENEEGRFEALNDQNTRDAIGQVLIEIAELRKVAQARLERSRESLAGSARDQAFDAAFASLLAEADNAETFLQVHITDELDLFQKTTYVLISLFLAAGLFILTALRRLEAGRQVYVDQLELSQADLAQAVTRLSHSNADLERFAAVAAHDLVEPTRTMESFCKLLSTRKADQLDSEAKEFVTTIAEGARRMGELVRGLLSLSKANHTSRAFTPVSLGSVCAAALDNLHQAIEDKQAEVRVGELPTVLADECLLTQVFQNLIANAIKFQPAGRRPEVSIHAVRRDRAWVVSVQDNGIGLNPQDAEEAFTAFRRLQGANIYPGSGLGLSLVRRVVEIHGGTIWVAQAAGEGALIQFTLPVLPDEKNGDPDGV
ncbi:MAG: hypothetical protein A2516_09975 [Alphaproteobacteria bacterium RIFOXYD12_FULL_60_8]|nr:MAG: hypothetical protein A2516_09975 [Alphaproteobacteria bacterium RIFOXYD12_FULL_60_8]